jgi:hypothetical protein
VRRRSAARFDRLQAGFLLLDTEMALFREWYDNSGSATHRGTAQAGGASTVTLASGASATDDTYNNSTVTITGGTGIGQTRTITDYVGSSRVATVDSAWTTTPDSTSTYDVSGGAAGGAGWFDVEIASGDGGRTTVEARFTEPWDARMESGMKWNVGAVFDVRA